MAGAYLQSSGAAMINSPRQLKLLTILRKNTFQGRSEFYQTALKDLELAERGEILIYNDLRVLEEKKCVSIDRVGRGKRARMVTIRLTEMGLFAIASGELRGIVREAREENAEGKVQNTPARLFKFNRSGGEVRSQKRSKPEGNKTEPCGVVMKVCYHSGCYLAYKCNARKL